MILQECEACGSDEGCVLISFAMTRADHAWAASDVDGHPPWQAWYCEKHERVARQFTRLPRDEASIKIMEIVNASDE